MTTTFIADKDKKRIDAASATIPSDRYFRNAWALNGNVITEDVAAAKVLFRDKIREVRVPLLAEEDVAYMKSLESGDTDAQTASIAKKNALRDAPAASAITNANTIVELKAAWDTSVLGTSPYAK